MKRTCRTVTLLVSAYNEAEIIGEKIVNSLNLDYPKDRIEIVIVSDGSTDGTDDIVRGYEDQGVSLLSYTPNRGKIAALNDAMAHIDTEVVVFSDANVMYDGQALRKLVRNFKDPRVGAVSGKVLLLSGGVSYGAAEERYYGIEHYIQAKEGETGAMVGADGAMYAIRRRLFKAPPAGTILDDFVIAMEIARQGFMVVHDSEALGTEKNMNEVREEFRRKARIIAGGVQCLVLGCGLPKMSQVFLWFKFLSHKVLRWFSGALMVVLISALCWLDLTGAGEPIGLRGLYYLILLSLMLAVAGQLFPPLRRMRLVNFSHYFFMLNFASLVGCYRGLTGRQRVAWRAP